MKRVLIALLSFAGLFIVGCENGLNEENNNSSTPKIELAQQSIEVEFESGTYSVQVTSPYSWRAESDSEWLVVKSATGIAGTKELKFSVTRNEEESERDGTITLTNASYNLVAEFYVIQKPFAPSFTVGTESLSFGVEGGSQEVVVTANFEYEIATSADWLSYENSENGITITAPAHVEAEERTAEVVISNEKYNIEKSIKVTQSAFVPELTLDKKEFNFEVGGGNATVNVNTNIEFTASSSVDWITCTTIDNSVEIVVAESGSISERTAEVVISNEKYNIREVVKISQEKFVPELSIEKSELNFEVGGGNAAIGVTANAEYTASSSAGWVSCSITESGVNIRVAASGEIDVRTAEVTITLKGYNLSEVVKISQEKFVPEFEVENVTSLEYDFKHNERVISVTSNFVYDVTSSANWIGCEKVSDGVKLTLPITYDTTVGDRTAEIKIYSSKYDVEARVIQVTQKACPHYIGELVELNGSKGIIYSINKGGYDYVNNKYFDNGGIKAISVDEAYLPWRDIYGNEYVGIRAYEQGYANMLFLMRYLGFDDSSPDWQHYEAFEWCYNHGKGWYLPAYTEIEEAFQEKEKVNAALSANGYTVLASESGYNTSTELDANHTVCFHGGNASKRHSNLTRAIIVYFY